MKEETRTKIEKVWVCDTCGKAHYEDWYGKWSIFHCSQHGEFCNAGVESCGIFRYKESHHSDLISCPICGWSTNDSYNKEPYDSREGDIPRTEKEIQSFQRQQEYILKHTGLGYISHDRIANPHPLKVRVK